MDRAKFPNKPVLQPSPIQDDKSVSYRTLLDPVVELLRYRSPHEPQLCWSIVNWLLKDIGQDQSRRILPLLVAALSDADAFIRMASVAVLRKIGPAAAPAAQHLVPLLCGDPSPNISPEVIEALIRIKPPAQLVVPPLVAMLESFETTDNKGFCSLVHDRALRLLASYGSCAAPAVPYLARRLNKRVFISDDAILRTLAEIGEAARSALPVIDALVAELLELAQIETSPGSGSLIFEHWLPDLMECKNGELPALSEFPALSEVPAFEQWLEDFSKCEAMGLLEGNSAEKFGESLRRRCDVAAYAIACICPSRARSFVSFLTNRLKKLTENPSEHLPAQSPEPMEHKSQIDQIGRLLGTSSADARFLHIPIALGKIGHAAQAALPTLRACLGLKVPGLFEVAELAFQRIYPINSPADTLLARLIPKAHRSEPDPDEIIAECFQAWSVLGDSVTHVTKIVFKLERGRYEFGYVWSEAVDALRRLVQFLRQHGRLRNDIELFANRPWLLHRLISRTRSRLSTEYRRRAGILPLNENILIGRSGPRRPRGGSFQVAPDVVVEARESEMKVGRLLETLKPRHRQVIEARILREEEISAIAEELNVPVETIYNDLELAKRVLERRPHWH